MNGLYQVSFNQGLALRTSQVHGHSPHMVPGSSSSDCGLIINVLETTKMFWVFHLLFFTMESTMVK